MARVTSGMRRFRAGPGALVYRTPLYGVLLKGRAPQALGVVPVDPWPGDTRQGQALLEGRFRFAGEERQADLPPWLDLSAGSAWLTALHGFDWLRHLKAAGGDAARRQARVLVTSWLDGFSSWHAVAWAPEVTAQRIVAWIGAHDFFLASADDGLRARVFDSLARQIRHLARLVPGRLRGVDLLLGIKGLVYGGYCLAGRERAAQRALWLLNRELARQVTPDGGHVQRSPSLQLQALRHLIDIRGVLRAAKADMPDALQHTIDRLTPTLRFFRHGDGGLALFNGGWAEDPAFIDTVLSQADARGRPLRSAPHVGFERLAAGRTCVLLDAGAPPPAGLDARAHAGTLSFEMSVGRERLIVNCGSHPSETGAWRGALASTAAHSTLVVADTNSASVREDGGLGRRPHPVEAKRRETGGAVLVEAAHDGYRDTFGLIHHRRLYLAESGEDMRGEDRLEGGAGGHTYTLRFHLHPGVHASLSQGGDGVLLRLPSGAGWRLRLSGGTVGLEESVYLGDGPEPRGTLQVTVRGETAPGGATVKWALRREKKAEGADP
ncbi:heparinase II/III family protein [Azospirillum sp. B4]|uniref:heparinase II/III family protein n=1 Tax=Azospirillum sp. B4 TaxID=95605 RepID=UPI00034542EE|nr:heparinase II/III family protein [Azospirillum sp. B4]